MKRKPFLAIIAMLLLTTLIVKSQSSDNNVVELILSSYSAKAFSTQPVTDIEIPTAQIVDGREFTIKDAGFNANVNNITVNTEGAELIEGQASLVFTLDGDSFTLYAYGGNSEYL